MQDAQKGYLLTRPTPADIPPAHPESPRQPLRPRTRRPAGKAPIVLRFTPHVSRFILLTRQFPIPYPVRLIGFFAQPLFPIRFILAVVPFEPHYLAVAFEGQHVGGDPVEK